MSVDKETQKLVDAYLAKGGKVTVGKPAVAFGVSLGIAANTYAVANVSKNLEVSDFYKSSWKKSKK